MQFTRSDCEISYLFSVQTGITLLLYACNLSNFLYASTSRKSKLLFISHCSENLASLPVA